MASHRPASLLASAFAAFVVLAATGCDEPEDRPTGEPPEFREVAAIFEASRCATGGCHDATAAQGELSMEGSDAWAQLIDVECADAEADEAGFLRVKPGDSDASFLMTKLTLDRVDAALGLPMPPSGERLTDDELDLVRRWIEAGAEPPVD